MRSQSLNLAMMSFDIKDAEINTFEATFCLVVISNQKCPFDLKLEIYSHQRLVEGLHGIGRDHGHQVYSADQRQLQSHTLVALLLYVY
jgi:hypothetical protein